MSSSSSAADRAMTAREGRDKQRYAASGARLVAGVVALTPDKSHVLVVSSTQRQDKFVLPKGGYETDEPTPQDAAIREAWEEAGVVGKITESLGVIDDLRPPKLFANPAKPATHPRAEYHFFEMQVEDELDVWPESNKRIRKWISYKEAVGGLINRPELLEALKRSSIDRSL
ncbi:NUDIX hydrolase domain-like protein [Lipomyces japonicus]|uniref:NUDIX hydrolase domain-like protein n=1 Tax=Lipomyces japonicus TaxID=56871 RepID=UPI0034CE0195